MPPNETYSRAPGALGPAARLDARLLASSLDPARGRVVAYFPGGGITGALYQLGVLTALEASIPELRAHKLSAYVGVGSGAVLGAALAGGLEAQRVYRGLLDPADPFFSIERKHVFRFDVEEWRGMIVAALGALRNIGASATRKPLATATDPWAELDRFYDVLPAGIFSLEHLERFLDAFFSRRGIPQTFRELPCRLVTPAHDLDSGEAVLFGVDAHAGDRIARAACASMALSPFFAPVRIGDRRYLAGSTCHGAALEAAASNLRANTILVVNPMVPVGVGHGARVVTGHGDGRGVADKGLLWVFNQAMRIGDYANLHAEIALLRERHPEIDVVLIEPTRADAMLFMDSPMKYDARRSILEDAFRSTRDRLRGATLSVVPPRG